MSLRLLLSGLALSAFALPAHSQSAPYPRAGFRAQLAPMFHNVQGTVTIVDADTLLVEDFFYDGGGASVFFRLGAQNTFGGFLNGISIGPQLLGQVFNAATFLIDLPPGVTLDGYHGVAVWCVPATFSFGNGPLLQQVPEPYCTAKNNSQGCTPQIGFVGLPSATSAAGFEITAAQVISNQPGLMFYGQHAAATAFAGGTLCVAPPLRRTPVQNSLGNPGASDCSGIYSFDFRSRIQSGQDPALVAGAQVFAQYWQRDQGAAFQVGLSNGLTFYVAP